MVHIFFECHNIGFVGEKSEDNKKIYWQKSEDKGKKNGER
jgi:hypothetical protein